MSDYFKANKTQEKIWSNMTTGEHMRLSLDGKTIWPDYGRQFKDLKQARNLMIHDYDLGAIKGSFEEVQRIMRRARTDGWATRLGMKFPVRITDGQSLLNWSSFLSNSTFYSIRYDGVIEDDAFNDWVGLCRERAIFSSIEYYVTSSSYDENHFIKILLPKIFRQVIISRSYRIFFALKYDEGFFTDSRWEDVLQLFNYYHNSYASQLTSKYIQRVPDDTLYDFAKATSEQPSWFYQGKCFTKSKIREIFAFVHENHYELFKDFYECNAIKLGGKL